MQSILIVESSDVLRSELERELRKSYRIYSCAQGDEGLRLQTEHQPDGLIVNLVLHGIDGLFLLEHMAEPRPKAIVTLSSIYPPYIQQRLMDLGVDYSVIIPCPVRIIAHRMRDILEHSDRTVPPDAQAVIVSHLQKLGVPHWGGYDDLRVGVPLFAQDPSQSMTKEFYPSVAVLRGRDNWQQVEKAIRDVKEYAYEHRNDAVWREYFLDASECPTNKAFIARLSEFLK